MGSCVLHGVNINGILSMKLHRELGMTPVAAWHMLQRIRQVLRNSNAMLPVRSRSMRSS